MITLYKKDTSEIPSNYRQISLLFISGKIFGKIMHKGLCNFLESNGVLYFLQLGFRSKRSTTHTLINMKNIRNIIDNGNYGCGILIDLQKTFDTVSHSILLRKLYHCGIRGVPLQWFESYLSDQKTIYVLVNGHTSNYRWFPQALVLGPLMFLTLKIIYQMFSNV